MLLQTVKKFQMPIYPFFRRKNWKTYLMMSWLPLQRNRSVRYGRN